MSRPLEVLRRSAGLVAWLALGALCSTGCFPFPAGTPDAGPDASVAGGCGAALAGFTRCTGALLQRCDGATWGLKQDCAPSTCEVLSDSEARCASSACSPFGALRCSTTTLQQCEGAAWKDVNDCAPQACVATSATTASCQGASPCTRSGTYKVCSGAAVVDCSGTTEATRIDCANVTGSLPTNGTCYDFGGTVGPTCVLPQGSQCLFMDSLGNSLYMACGRNGLPAADMGCDYDDGCTVGLSGCTPSSFRRSCPNSTRLIVACTSFGSLNQPLSMNCTSSSWGSGVCQNGICVTSTRDAGCAAGLVACQPPLTCVAETCR